jgi:putative nucleotidyltransferase with HDIG domain
MANINLTVVFLLLLIVLFVYFILIYSKNYEYEKIKEMRDLLDLKVRELSELHNVSSAISSLMELSDLLDMVLAIIMDVLKVERISLFLFDENKENLILRAGKGLKPELINNLTIRVGEGIIGKVAQSGEAILIKDIEKEMPELAKKRKEEKRGYKTKSFLCVPLKIKKEVIGVLSVNNKKNEEPFNENDKELLTILATQISVAIENSNLYNNMKDSYKSTIKALSTALDAKDSYTGGHSAQVTKYALPIAREMGLDKEFIEKLEYAGLLHDIGKIGIIENILNKKGRLTDEEFEIIKKHPVIGAEILESIPFLGEIVPMVKYHHERWDGRGYPEGLKGEEIPLGARIISVADTFDAMTSDRPYRKGLPAEIAREEIEKNAGTQFDPKVVEAFLKAYDKGEIKVEKYDYKNRWL